MRGLTERVASAILLDVRRHLNVKAVLWADERDNFDDY
jgi:hypothetical protein